MDFRSVKVTEIASWWGRIQSDERKKLVFNQHYFHVLGVNTLMRKIAKTLTSTTQLLKLDEDRFCLKTRVLKHMKVEFTPNEEFEEKTLDGRKVKSTIVFDDDKMIHTQHGEKPLVIERRFFNDEMIAISTCGDIVSTSWSKLVEWRIYFCFKWREFISM